MTEALTEAVTGTDGRGGQLGPIPTMRPYTPDLFGWFDDFSTTGGYDALGGISRTQVYINFLDRLPLVSGLPAELVLQTTLDTAKATLTALKAIPAPTPAQEAIIAQLEAQIPVLERLLARIDAGSGFGDVDDQEFKRCPGASETRAGDGSNVFSSSQQRALDCRESDRATGEGT
jgi:hypothetical protein